MSALDPTPRLAFLAAGVTIILWASAFAGVRAGLEEFSPAHLTLLRFLFASLALVVYAIAIRMKLPTWRDLPMLTIGALLGIVGYHTLLNLGLVRVTAAAASLLIASVPVFTALLAATFLREHMRRVGWLGILVSFSGAALIALGEGRSFHLEPSALLILGAALAHSVFVVIQKPVLTRYGPIRYTTHVIWIGTVVLLVFAPGLSRAIRQAPVSTTLAVAYLGVFPSAIAYLTIAYALSLIPATRTASFLYMIPALATLIAWLWLGELPGSSTFLGGGLTLAGVFIVNRWGRVRAAASVAAPGPPLVSRRRR